MKDYMRKLSYIGVLPSDCEDLILKKSNLTLLPFFVLIPATLWSMIYIYLYQYQAATVPMIYILISMLSAFILHKTKKFIIFEFTQLSLILLLPFILMWSLGGFEEGGFVMIWAFYAPVVAIMYSKETKDGMRWFYAFLVLVFISMIIDSSLQSNINNPLPKIALELFIVLNIGAGFGGIFFLISRFVKNIKEISTALKEDRESLYTLTNDLKNANRELEHLATCDIVTKLPNRLYFQDIVYDMFKRAKLNEKIVAIMFLDLDGFKTVNDTLGHDAGDQILKVVGNRLKSVIRDTDTVARVGGDEFAIAIGDLTDVDNVKKIAENIIEEVNEYCPYNDHRCRVGVSIGISFYPEHGESVDDLLVRADKAMYEIKKMGKNSYSIYNHD